MHRLVYAVTFRVEGIEGNGPKADFARRLAVWARSQQYTTHWLETPEGQVPEDLSQRPLIVYEGTLDQPELGVTFLPPLETVRVSYFACPDFSPSQTHEIGAKVALEIGESCGQKLSALYWELYGKSLRAGSPYLLLEGGRFEPVDQVPVYASDHASKSGVETWN